jgi:hypothetical protein
MSSERRRRIFADDSRYLDRFGLLLAVVVVAIVSLSVVDLREPWGDRGAELFWLMTALLVGAALLLALRAAGLARTWRRVADVFVGVGVASAAVLVVLPLAFDSNPGNIDSPSASILMVVLSIGAPLVVIRRVLQHRAVTQSTLLGAVSAYLLIPVAFYYVYLALETIQGQPFFGQPEPTTSYMYFSLSTVSTVGYGDLTPASSWGRLLSSSEAIIGQVYLVTFVAMLVGLYASQRLASKEPT